MTYAHHLPGARVGGTRLDNASVASNGANALVGLVDIAPSNARLRAAWWAPTGRDQGNNTASYRLLKVINGGTAGTGTAVVASLALSASKASLGPVAMTVVTSATIASGAALYFSQETVGGTDATGTVLRAGSVRLSYEQIA
jgi:hypothetical protein